jgi:uncharacterized RDD family membrane protein YckC
MTIEPAPNYRFAGFWWRVLALFVDNLVLMVINAIGGMVVTLSLIGADWTQEGMQAFTGLLALIWSWLYFALFESSAWRATPGKKACGLIVTDENGARISFARATGRYFAKFLSALILGIGFMMAGWTRRKQGLHDIICDTLVLKKVDPVLRIEVPRAA